MTRTRNVTAKLEKGAARSNDGGEESTAPMGAELTVRQKILVSAVAQSTDSDSFTVEDLVVGTWKLFPESFSLKGYTQYPDSNRVLAKLSGTDGLCGLGWLEHTDQRTYQVTRKGRVVAKQLAGVQSAVVGEAGDEAEAAPPRPARATPIRVVGSEETAGVVKARPPRAEKAKVPKVAVVTEAPRKATPAVTLSTTDLHALGMIAKAEALRKFLRGSPLSFNDACHFWGISTSMRPAMVQQRLDGTAELLKRAVESFGDDGPSDPRMPTLSTCYGLFNLHRLMTEKFSRELDALRLPLAASGGG